MYHLKIEVIKNPNSESSHIQQNMESERAGSLSPTTSRGPLKEKEQEAEGEIADIQLKVAVGNPEIEVIQGIMHLYKENSIDSPSKKGQLPVSSPTSLNGGGREFKQV